MVKKKHKKIYMIHPGYLFDSSMKEEYFPGLRIIQLNRLSTNQCKILTNVDPNYNVMKLDKNYIHLGPRYDGRYIIRWYHKLLVKTGWFYINFNEGSPNSNGIKRMDKYERV
jgi:hypothetical protein